MADSAGTSRRARQMFTDSYAPAEWSFSTYARPFKSTGSDTEGNASKDGISRNHAVEEVLWALMVGDASYTATDSSTGIVTAESQELLSVVTVFKIPVTGCRHTKIIGY